MPLSCSLDCHPQKYHMHCHEALLAPLVSPYALRHAYLAQSSTQWKCWGHRLIAAIEFIPIIGLLASAIERIVYLAFKWLSKGLTQKKQMQASALPLQKAIIPIVSPTFLAMQNRVSLLAQPIIPVATAADVKAAEVLIEFCKAVPGGEAQLNQLSEHTPIQKADALRRWMSQDPRISSLDSLELRHLNLSTLPPEIKYFTKMTQLGLYDMPLQTLPPEIGTLANLDMLTITRCQLNSLPLEIGSLKKLTYLWISCTSICVLPAEIGDLTELTQLYIRENPLLTELPPEMGKLANLTFLNVSGNKLKAIPRELCQLQNCITFEANDNEIDAIPSEIGNMTKLIKLNFGYNQLASIPATIGNMRKNLTLSIENNPLTTIPNELALLVDVTLRVSQHVVIPAGMQATIV